jgi:hypothetical protein
LRDGKQKRVQLAPFYHRIGIRVDKPAATFEAQYDLEEGWAESARNVSSRFAR